MGHPHPDAAKAGFHPKLSGRYFATLLRLAALDFGANKSKAGGTRSTLAMRLTTAECGSFLPFRQFVPYAGYVWSHKFGDTADLAEAADEPAQDRGWVAGVRFWF